MTSLEDMNNIEGDSHNIDIKKHCKLKKLDRLDIPKYRAEFHFSRAEKLLKEGNNTTLELERICIELTRACSLKPKDVNYFLGLAECFRRACDSSSAIFALRFALTLQPGEAAVKMQLSELLVNRAQEMMKLGKHFDKASKYFEEALALDSSRDNIWLLRAVCEIHCKNFSTALQCINRTINLSSVDLIDAHVLRAKIHWAMGHLDVGNKDMRKAMAIDENHPEVVAFVNRSFADARRLYDEGVEHFKAGDSEKAIKSCQSALAINGEDIKLYLMLSKMHRQKGDLHEAFQYLKDAEKQFTKSDPYHNFPNHKIPFEITRQQNIVINEMAMQEAIKGDCEKAIVLLNKAISSERNINSNANDIPFVFFMNRGDCYRALNEPLFAIADYKLALERSPDNWDIMTKLSMSHYLLAVDYFNDSKFLSCYEQIDGAIALNDKVPEYYSLRGKAAYFQGFYHEAYMDFKRVLEKNPGDDEIQKFMRQFETPPEKETLSETFPLQKERKENTSMQRTRLSTTAKKKLIPSAIDITDDPLGVNTDQSVLQRWAALPHGEQRSLDSPIEVSRCTADLPTVNPYLAASVVFHDAAKPRLEELKRTVHSRTSVQESSLWTLIRDAERQARSMRKPTKGKTDSNLTEAQVYANLTKKIPASSTGLKQRSLQRSKEALKNPIVAGVVPSRSDPMLLSAQLSKSRTRQLKPKSKRLTAKERRLQQDRLNRPTESYQHHHDPDEQHVEVESVSERVENNPNQKPYMQHKRERTLTEFLLSPASSFEERELKKSESISPMQTVPEA